MATEHIPDYSQFCEQPVEAEDHDIVIFGCQCGTEGCTWQALIRTADLAGPFGSG